MGRGKAKIPFEKQDLSALASLGAEALKDRLLVELGLLGLGLRLA